MHTSTATVYLSLPACFIILLCALVFVQVLGVPMTMITALMPSTCPEASVAVLGTCTISGLFHASISECFSLLHPSTELRRLAAFRLVADNDLTTNPQVVPFSVFHPPII